MDGLVLKEIALHKERTTIGRKPHNDVQIDNLAISGEHAVIVTILNDSFLEDLNSTNGTYVNGQPVKKHFLQHNDVVELGKYRLKYINEGQSSRGLAADYEKTTLLRPNDVRPPVVPSLPRSESEAQAALTASAQPGGPGYAAAQAQATAVSEAPRPPAAKPLPMGVIQLLNGANAGKELELSKTLTTLGKPGVQVAVITRRPHGYFITHVEGANFPVLNGRTLDTQAHPLNDHDVIELAGVKMEFFLRP
jgi:pSer/pThr/pTyr-binding forkhead associated (FHA) protein